ncbi:MAG: single-stranded-DNA-specific exonuclease RecJ, partial [Desulfovibrio sp.]
MLRLRGWLPVLDAHIHGSNAIICIKARGIGDPDAFAYTPRLDTYNGITSVDVGIKDWQPAS